MRRLVAHHNNTLSLAHHILTALEKHCCALQRTATLFRRAPDLTPIFLAHVLSSHLLMTKDR